MSTRRPWLLIGLMMGCGGGQLAELEEDQDRLRKDFTDLQANVTHLRNEMVELGLVTAKQSKAKAQTATPARAKKGRRGPGNVKPERELSDVLPWKAARTGKPSALPSAPSPERTESPCGWSVHVEELQPISDFPLNRDGFGKSSPVSLLENGEPLTPHAMPDTFEENCTGSYRHAGYLFLFSPTGAVDDAATRKYEIALSPDFPLSRGDDDRPMYWVYPGTTATFTIDAAWDEAWGDPRLILVGKVLLAQNGSATVSAPGLDRALDTAGAFTMTEMLEPEGPFTVTISSPDAGPFVLIDTMTLGNPENALVITAEAAWAGKNK